jgi:hypothetical protein
MPIGEQHRLHTPPNTHLCRAHQTLSGASQLAGALMQKRCGCSQVARVRHSGQQSGGALLQHTAHGPDGSQRLASTQRWCTSRHGSAAADRPTKQSNGSLCALGYGIACRTRGAQKTGGGAHGCVRRPQQGRHQSGTRSRHAVACIDQLTCSVQRSQHKRCRILRSTGGVDPLCVLFGCTKAASHSLCATWSKAHPAARTPCQQPHGTELATNGFCGA